MRIIFLDIDGVLNSSEDYYRVYEIRKDTGEIKIPINEHKLELLKQIVEESEAFIVLSSSWRIGFNKETLEPIFEDTRQLVNLLCKYGMFIYSLTPRSFSGKREDDIKEWLNEHSNISSFVILDDESYDLQSLSGYLVKTSENSKSVKTQTIYENSGLKEEHVKSAVRILKKDC